MLLIEVKPYQHDFHLFGQVDPHDPLELQSTALNTDRSVQYAAFKSPFEYQAHDSTLKLMGYMAFPYAMAFSLQHEETAISYSMPTLVMWYMRNQVKTPFAEWIRTIPTIGNRRSHGNMGILRSDEGGYYLFYVEKGQVKHEEITVTSFIQDGVMTPMSEVIAGYEMAAVKRLEETRTFLAAIAAEDNWKLPEQLSYSDFLRTVPSRL